MLYKVIKNDDSVSCICLQPCLSGCRHILFSSCTAQLDADTYCRRACTTQLDSICAAVYLCIVSDQSVSLIDKPLILQVEGAARDLKGQAKGAFKDAKGEAKGALRNACHGLPCSFALLCFKHAVLPGVPNCSACSTAAECSL